MALVIIDQSAKAYAKSANIVTTNNQGAFSLPIPPILTIVLSIIILSAAIYLAKMNSNSKLQKSAFVLLIAGGTSNLLDRLINQHVVDMISIHTANINLADIYIITGAIILVFHLFIFRGNRSL